MQTFLAYKSFVKSALVLDYRRLGKQRVEAFQIHEAINAIKLDLPYGWKNHPAIRMWFSFPNALKEYHNIIIQEWIDRGYKNNMPFFRIHDKVRYPDWLGYHKLHSTHRANLIRKDPKFYSQYNWKEKPLEGYYWPV